MKKLEIIMKLCAGDVSIGIQFRDTYYIGIIGSQEEMRRLLKEMADSNNIKELACKLLHLEREFPNIRKVYNYKEHEYYIIKEHRNDGNVVEMKHKPMVMGISEERVDEKCLPSEQEIWNSLKELRIDGN